MIKVEAVSISEREIFLLPILLKKISWGIVVLLLLFLPFQFPLHRNLNLAHWFLWIDEVLIVFAFGMFLLALSFQGKIKKRIFQILLCLLLVVVIGIISALYNANPFIISAGGTFNYIKCFLVIPIFYLFSIPRRKVISLYKLLHSLALFLCLVAILQEIVFFIGGDVAKIGASDAFVYMRFGLMRTPSLLGHPNVFGLYSLLFFILDFSLHRRLRWQNLLLFSGIILSGSRIAWAAFYITFFYLLIQRNRRILLMFVLVTTIIIAVTIPYLQTFKELTSETYYRKYTILKSIEIWKDHPFLGVGSGMYGGWIIHGFESPVFEKYGFKPEWLEMMKKHRTLDSFWFQHLAESGLFGTSIFIILLIVLCTVARREMLLAKDLFRRRMLCAFSVIPIIITAYLFANVLNVTAFLLTYCMLFGIVLGIKDESPLNQ